MRLRICLFIVLAIALCGAVAQADAWNGGPKKIGDPVGVVVFDVYERDESGQLVPLYMPGPDGRSVRAGVMPAPKNGIIIARLRAFTRDRRMAWWECRMNGVPLTKQDALNADYTTHPRNEKGQATWDTKRYGELAYDETDMDPYKVFIDTSRLASTTHMVEFLTSSTNGLGGFAQGQFQVSDMTIEEFREQARQHAGSTEPRVTTQTTVTRSLTKPAIPAGAVDLTGDQQRSAPKVAVPALPKAPAAPARPRLVSQMIGLSNGRFAMKVEIDLPTDLVVGDTLTFNIDGEQVAKAKITAVRPRIKATVTEGAGNDISDTDVVLYRTGRRPTGGKSR